MTLIKLIRRDIGAFTVAAEACDRWSERTRADLVKRGTPELLTVLLIIVNPVNSGFIGIGLRIIALIGLLFRDLQTSFYYWAIIAAGVWWALYSDWYFLDNHKFLLGYWCAALVLSSTLPEHRDFITQRSARLLVAASFLFAVLWKAISPDYLDGRFFEYVLLLDPRFAEVAQTFGGGLGWEVAINRAARAALVAPDSTLTSVELVNVADITSLAIALTWVVFVVELLVAVFFVLPWRGLAASARHWFLLAFILGTYVIAPVFGYGWVLAVLGLSDTPIHKARTRAAFVIVVVVLEAYRLRASI